VNLPPERLVLQKIQIEVNVTSVFGAAPVWNGGLYRSSSGALACKNRAAEHSYTGPGNFVGE